MQIQDFSSTAGHLSRPDDASEHLGVHGRPQVSTAVVSTALAVGPFVPKPTRDTDCQRCGLPGLDATVRQCLLASAAVGRDCY